LRGQVESAIIGRSQDFRIQALTPKGEFGLFSPLFNGYMYAVIETGGKQYRVTAGDTLEVERLTSEAGQTFTFDRVLLTSNDGKVAFGDALKNTSVLADIVEHKRGPKTIAFKMKRRKGYHRTVGHRQELTVVKIKEIKA
jgi:large subunit ribosomal protein L21